MPDTETDDATGRTPDDWADHPAVQPDTATAEPEPVEVTDAMREAGYLVGDDWQPEDTVWELNGTRVKVKTFADPNAPLGAFAYRISGSIVGDDGKALRRADGAPFIYVQPHQFYWAAENPDASFEEALQKARCRMVKATELAHRHTAKQSSFRGVGVLPNALNQPLPVGPPTESSE